MYDFIFIYYQVFFFQSGPNTPFNSRNADKLVKRMASALIKDNLSNKTGSFNKPTSQFHRLNDTKRKNNKVFSLYQHTAVPLGSAFPTGSGLEEVGGAVSFWERRPIRGGSMAFPLTVM